MFLIVQGQLFIVTFIAPYPVPPFLFLKINYKMLYRLPASLVYRFADSHSISRSVNMLSNGASLSLERGKRPQTQPVSLLPAYAKKNVKYAGVLYGSMSGAGISSNQRRIVFKLVFFMAVY